MTGQDTNVQLLIESNGLIPHPEGGFFRETYRYGAEPMASKGLTDPEAYLISHPTEPDARRNLCTVMQYLITKEKPMQYLVCLDTDNIRFWSHGGAALYSLYDPKQGRYWEIILGPELDKGHVQHFVTPAGTWVGCQLVEGSEYSFLCEVVAPGFDAKGVEFVTSRLVDGVASTDVKRKLSELLAPQSHSEVASEEVFKKVY